MFYIGWQLILMFSMTGEGLRMLIKIEIFSVLHVKDLQLLLVSLAKR